MLCRHSTSKPAVIRSLEHESIVQVAAGGWHCVAVTNEGKMYAWGGNEYFQCGLDAGTRAACGRTQTRIITLSLSPPHLVLLPTAVLLSLSSCACCWCTPSKEHIKHLRPGLLPCCAPIPGSWLYIMHLRCAGTRDICVPKPTVPFLTVSMVSCGGMHSVALTTTGHVWQWGEPWGDFSMEVNRSPRKLNVENVLSIASGAFHNVALDNCNQVLSWGTNDFGQLGTGDTTYHREPHPVQGLSEENIADVAAEGWHSLAITDAGQLFTWGRGEYGRLGLNDPKGKSQVRPRRVPGMQGQRVIQVWSTSGSLSPSFFSHELDCR